MRIAAELFHAGIISAQKGWVSFPNQMSVNKIVFSRKKCKIQNQMLLKIEISPIP